MSDKELGQEIVSARLRGIRNIAPLLATEIAAILDRNTRTCMSCLQFVERSETCNLVGKRPPARVIATGCEKYEEDIPF